MTDLTEFIPSISNTQAKACFDKLLAHPASENPGRCMAGMKPLQKHFKEHVMRCKTKTGLSFADIVNDPEKRQKYEIISKKYNSKLFDAFQLWNGCINMFRPAVAKWLYKRYNAQVGVLDFSAGWGGRMLGAFALGIPYIGVETNRNLIDPYHRLFLDYNHFDSPLQLIWGKAEDTDFSRMQYDVVMTSPPYYTLEKYEHMPAYASKEDFYNTFLIPVITKAWLYLKPNGHMILNMPVELYEAVRNHLPPVFEVLEYHKAGRHNAMKNGSKKAQSFEHIYVWRKSTS
jgi:hypothetical protein